MAMPRINRKPPLPRGKSGRRIRALKTPEGVPLNLELANVGERAAAFALDFTFLSITLVVMTIGLAFLAGMLDSPRLLVILVLLLSFLLRGFYFIFFEMRWQGQTPGKRIMKIKVINRSDGTLSADAIFARNLTREIELFLPLTALMSSNTIAGASGWTALFATVWLFILLFFPLFNRDHLRAGDLIAGTLVVHKADQILLGDIASHEEGEGLSDIHFTAAQLDAYGIFELQKLEELLRSASFWDRPEEQKTIARVIAGKIGWEGDEPRDRTSDFLMAFYRGLRGRLEGQLLMGHRRADKHDTDANGPVAQ